MAVNRRTFLKAGASTAVLLLSLPAWCAQVEEAKLTDDDILAQTKARIEQHRKGDGTIRVLAI